MIRAIIVDDEAAGSVIIRYFIKMGKLPIEIVDEARDGAAALELVFWLLMVLFAPWTLLLLPVAAVWFITYAALFVLYDDWEEAFHLEEQIAEQFPDQPVRRD